MIAPRTVAGRFVPMAALGLLILASAGNSEDALAQEKSAGPTPQAQVVTFGLGSADEGERLYGRECAFCHVGKNTGTIMLGRRMDPARAELHKRIDLDAAYVKVVVRNGLVNMPPLTKVEVTDRELDKIAAWLARRGKRK